MRFKYQPSRCESLRLSRQRPDRDGQRCVLRYAHVAVPTTLVDEDRAALMFGLELAALHEARLTVLHIRPAAEPLPTANHLDAITLLHRALDQWHDRVVPTAHCDSSAKARGRVVAFLRRIVPHRLREQVQVDVQCRAGALAECIERLASEAGVDLVIVPTGRSRWWLPVLPSPVRSLMRLIRPQVILVPPDRQTREGIPSHVPQASTDRGGSRSRFGGVVNFTKSSIPTRKGGS